MKQRRPALAPLLRSDLQGELLALTLLHPDTEYTLTELANKTGAALTTVHTEISRLVTSDLLTDRKVGSARLVKANAGSRLYEPTRGLIEATYGPAVVLESFIADHDKVDQAFIFGSWAARRQGKYGPAPHDVDVIVVGDLSRREAYHLAEKAEAEVGFPVNIEVVRTSLWETEGDPFIDSVRQGPLIRLVLEGTAA